jgi:ABC-type branched-subunit amino acid transport system substrate-binding protein
MHFMKLNRRQVLLAGAAAAVAAPALAQPGRSAGKPFTVAQIIDTTGAQQDVSKDFLIGSRAAWQDINSKGGVRGRPVQHLHIETDGSPASLRAALMQVRDNPGCLLMCGTAGDAAATGIARLLQQENVALAHVAPWLQNSSIDIDERTFPIFAARQEQIAHAMKSLTVMSVTEVGAVFASAREHQLYHEDVERTAAELKLKLRSYRAGDDLHALGRGLGASSPAILLFIGGTPELVQFTQGLDKQARQRYVVALADVNLQTMLQMGAARSTPVIATQAVPMTSAGLPVVRHYRETLARLFDEPPTALSLAGFIAARYAIEVLGEADLGSRQGVLAAFQRRAPLDVGGYRVAFDPRRRSATYVTQSMLTSDGRVVG